MSGQRCPRSRFTPLGLAVVFAMLASYTLSRRSRLGAALNMSGGQQQRVAVARALAMSPNLVLADEPTGNLDTKAANGVFELMRDVNRRSAASFLLVTHNMDLARRCDRIIEVVDGRIQTGTGG